MPFVIAGHNEHVAWGFTALYGDVQDLYIEQLDGRGNFKVADGNWHPLNLDHETIRVRGRKDVDYDVRLTDHGPLLDPIFTTAFAEVFKGEGLRSITTLPRTPRMKPRAAYCTSSERFVGR